MRIIDSQVCVLCAGCQHDRIVLRGGSHLVQGDICRLIDDVDRTLACLNGQVRDHDIAAGLNIDRTGGGRSQNLATAIQSDCLVDGDDLRGSHITQQRHSVATRRGGNCVSQCFIAGFADHRNISRIRLFSSLVCSLVDDDSDLLNDHGSRRLLGNFGFLGNFRLRRSFRFLDNRCFGCCRGFFRQNFSQSGFFCLCLSCESLHGDHADHHHECQSKGQTSLPQIAHCSHLLLGLRNISRPITLCSRRDQNRGV